MRVKAWADAVCDDYYHSLFNFMKERCLVSYTLWDSWDDTGHSSLQVYPRHTQPPGGTYCVRVAYRVDRLCCGFSFINASLFSFYYYSGHFATLNLDVSVGIIALNEEKKEPGLSCQLTRQSRPSSLFVTIIIDHVVVYAV